MARGKASETQARNDALLAPVDLAEDAEREASVVLAGVALDLAGGDPQAAKGPLSDVLMAIGTKPYEPVVPLNPWGQRKPERGTP